MFRQYIDLLQAKAERSTDDINEFIAKRDAQYWKWADWFAHGLTGYLASQKMTPADGIQYFLKESEEILGRTLAFWRTGKYSDSSQEEVLRAHYSKEEKMRQDMISLAISQFLWPQHYALFAFFLEAVSSRAAGIKSYLDIGPGHGLFMAAALELAQNLKFGLGVDISPYSVEMTRGMLSQLVKPGGTAKVGLECKDATTFSDDTTFDFVTVGEVITNVEDPRAFLERLARLLAPSGRMFVSACSNCPDSTIVYLFKNIGEIRSLFPASGLVIEKECVAPSVPHITEADHERRRLSVSYAAIVKRA